MAGASEYLLDAWIRKLEQLIEIKTGSPEQDLGAIRLQLREMKREMEARVAEDKA